MRRGMWALAFFVWLAVAVALTYATQRPFAAPVVHGLGRTAAALAGAAGLLLVAWALGDGLAARHPWPRLGDARGEIVLRVAVGFGLLGLSALALAALGWARPTVFRGLFALGLVAALGRLGNRLRAGRPRAAVGGWLRFPGAGWWWAAAVPALLLALAPAEAFDAHLYHLAQPAWVLRHGGLQPIALFSYWHPGLSEGVFTWALAVANEQTAQVLSLAAAYATVLLATLWAQEVWGPRTAAWVAPLFVAMPSALLLAAGAYVEWVLSTYGLAGLYLAWKARHATPARAPWVWVGVFTGLGMGTKYTAVSLPLAVGLFVLLTAPNRGAAFRRLAWVALTATFVAAPWYARNAYYMGNPFYPHFFGGYAWDAFRSTWLARPGTGLGLNLPEWLTLPWVATLGYKDASYYHGRIGPLFLGLAPLALAWMMRRPRAAAWRTARLAWGLYLGLTGLLWAVGVAVSQPLWQTRLLMPALAVSLPLWAYAVRWARVLDIPGRLRMRYVVRWVVAGVAAAAVLEWGVFVAQRHPLAYITGLEDRAAYYRRVFPDHQDLRTLLARHTPPDAAVYVFFEPRSYDLPREVLPDAFLDHWAWNLQRYGSPEAVRQALACAGWRYVVVYTWGLDFERQHDPWFTPDLAAAWEAFVADLEPVAQQGRYRLYRLPAVNSYNCASPVGDGPK